MPDDVSDVEVISSELVREASEQVGEHAADERIRELLRVGAGPARAPGPFAELTQAQLSALTDAIEQDLSEPGDKRRLEVRLGRVETATRVLAEAVIAMTAAQTVGCASEPAHPMSDLRLTTR